MRRATLAVAAAVLQAEKRLAGTPCARIFERRPEVLPNASRVGPRRLRF